MDELTRHWEILLVIVSEPAAGVLTVGQWSLPTSPILRGHDGTVVIADYSATENALPKPILRAYRLPTEMLR